VHDYLAMVGSNIAVRTMLRVGVGSVVVWSRVVGRVGFVVGTVYAIRLGGLGLWVCRSFVVMVASVAVGWVGGVTLVYWGRVVTVTWVYWTHISMSIVTWFSIS